MKPKRTLKLKCPTCGKQFERFASLVKGKKNHYCSNDCKNRDGALQRYIAPPAKELERLYDQFRTVADTARHLGVSPSTARRWIIVELGLTPHHRRNDRRVANNGYIRLRVGLNDWRLEHRVVMEHLIGRPLLATESVHHINGDRTNNRPENLELRHGSHGVGVRLAQVPHCPTCTCSQKQKKT